MKFPSLHPLHWKRAWRLVPTRIPRINLYERLADSKTQRDLIQLEQRTNPRIQAEEGHRALLRKGDHFHPRASVYVKAAFSNQFPSRFGNGHIPILYAGSDEPTALAEKQYHDVLFWRAHHIPTMSSKRRALHLEIEGSFHDIRHQRSSFPKIYSTSSYSASQKLGSDLWNKGSSGIAYDSVRDPKGHCIAVFSPQRIRSCTLGPVYEFHWNGKTITETFRLDPLP